MEQRCGGTAGRAPLALLCKKRLIAQPAMFRHFALHQPHTQRARAAVRRVKGQLARRNRAGPRDSERSQRLQLRLIPRIWPAAALPVAAAAD